MGGFATIGWAGIAAAGRLGTAFPVIVPRGVSWAGIEDGTRATAGLMTVFESWNGVEGPRPADGPGLGEVGGGVEEAQATGGWYERRLGGMVRSPSDLLERCAG